MKEAKIDQLEIQIKRILTFHYSNSDPYLFGIQLFDKDGYEILKTAPNCDNKPSYEIILADNERIIGIRSRKHSSDRPAVHYDFQFVIGKME